MRQGLWLLTAAGCGTSVDPAVKEAKDVGHEACDRYIDCLLEVTPEAVGPTLASYGPEGECWNTNDLQVLDICMRACAQGREGIGKIYPDVGECGECQNDDHCAEVENKSRCDVKDNECVTCLVNGDCANNLCHPSEQACVECVEDADCPGGACDPDNYRCVGCLGDNHCDGGVCDVEAQECVGCLANNDCPEGGCDLEVRQCVECLDEADCVATADCMNQRCVEHATICTPGDRRCAGEEIFEACADDGLGWKAAGSCVSPKVCEPETATCVNPVICPDGATDCVFNGSDVAVYSCTNEGTKIIKEDDCDAMGQSCDAGKCVNTTYGPCASADDTCALGSDVCTLGAQNDFYCAPKAVCVTDSDCPPGYPEGGDYILECKGGVCRMRCEPGECPPGMACRAQVANEGVCVWKY